MAEDTPVLLAANRGYRYGEGLFETIKVRQGNILLESFHFERLFSGLSMLRFDVPKFFTPEKLKQQILTLSKKNNCEEHARIRLSVFRGNGGLYEEDRVLQYIIECRPLHEDVNKLNENGLVIDIYPDARKSGDSFSNLKSANFLPYAMAALYAKENQLNDCLVMNTAGNIADSTIANVFLVKNARLITPDLNQGCVAGVMRRYLLEKLQKEGYDIQQSAITVKDIEEAEEIFLTNAINGIRWVGQFRNKKYSNGLITEVYARVFKTIF